MCPFSLEGEGCDEEEGITNRFYSPLPLGNCSLRCSTSCIHASRPAGEGAQCYCLKFMSMSQCSESS